MLTYWSRKVHFRDVRNGVLIFLASSLGAVIIKLGDKEMKTFTVKALNLNDVEVIQKIQAYTPEQAAQIVTRRNKYLKIRSVEIAS